MNYYPVCKNEILFVFIKLNVAINLQDILCIFILPEDVKLAKK